jgi:hypothetical protein
VAVQAASTKRVPGATEELRPVCSGDAAGDAGFDWCWRWVKGILWWCVQCKAALNVSAHARLIAATRLGHSRDRSLLHANNAHTPCGILLCHVASCCCQASTTTSAFLHIGHHISIPTHWSPHQHSYTLVTTSAFLHIGHHISIPTHWSLTRFCSMHAAGPMRYASAHSSAGKLPSAYTAELGHGCTSRTTGCNKAVHLNCGSCLQHVQPTFNPTSHLMAIL